MLQAEVSIVMTVSIIINFKIIYINKDEDAWRFFTQFFFHGNLKSPAVQNSGKRICSKQSHVHFLIFFLQQHKGQHVQHREAYQNTSVYSAPDGKLLGDIRNILICQFNDHIPAWHNRNTSIGNCRFLSSDNSGKSTLLLSGAHVLYPLVVGITRIILEILLLKQKIVPTARLAGIVTDTGNKIFRIGL